MYDDSRGNSRDPSHARPAVLAETLLFPPNASRKSAFSYNQLIRVLEIEVLLLMCMF
jgi:hypothetical protein